LAGETHGEEIHRWSGHSWFKGWWFDMVAIEQGVDEPREAPMVTNAELDRFETAIVNGEVLNYSFDDWKDHDLAFVAKARAALAAGKTVVLEHPVFTGTIYNPFYRKIVWRRVNQTWQLMLGFQCVAHIERSPNEGWPERSWMTVTSGDHEDYGYYGAHFSKLKGRQSAACPLVPRRLQLRRSGRERGILGRSAQERFHASRGNTQPLTPTGSRASVTPFVIFIITRRFPMTDRSLPPDPEGQTDDRGQSAQAAIRHFQIVTGCDWDDAIADLLADLMHLCDRETREDGETPLDFTAELERARQHYVAETAAGHAPSETV
jgi:hypothetical protein